MTLLVEIFCLYMSLLIPYFLGEALMRLILKRDKVFYFLEGIFYKWALGMGATTLYMFGLSLLKIKFNYLTLSLPAIVAVAFSYFFFKKSKNIQENHKFTISSPIKAPWNNFLWGFIIFNLAMVFVRVLFAEDNIWDNWTMWAYKAKVYLYHHGIPLERFPEFKLVWGNWDYPQHAPLLQAWVFEWLGYGNDYWPRFPYFIYFAGIGLIMYFGLRRLWNEIVGTLALFFMSSLIFLQQITIGILTEPILIFYYVAGVLLLIRAIKEKDMRLLVLSALFTGLTLWVKNEGSVLIMSTMIILVWSQIPLKEKIKWLAVYGFTAVAVNLPWEITKVVLDLKSYMAPYTNSTTLLNGISNSGTYVNAMIKLLLFLDVHNIVWLLFLYCVYKKLFHKVCPEENLDYFLWPILFQFAAYFLVFVIVPFPDRYSFDTLPRLMIAPTALAVMYSSVVLSYLVLKK